MRTLISTIVAIALFAHVLIEASGCQSHHCAEFPSVELSLHGVTACEHHEIAIEEGRHPVAPCDCHLHCASGCSYLPSQRLAFESLPSMDSLHGKLAFDTAIVVPEMPTHWHAANDWRAHGSPPQRLHLLHQIMLI
jgi:hypothetical protein